MSTTTRPKPRAGWEEYQQGRNRMSDRPHLINVSNPAAFGTQWNAESGTTIQLVNVRGTMRLDLGMRLEGATQWHTTSVVNPERFMSSPPVTNADWSRVVEAWFAAAEDQQ